VHTHHLSDNVGRQVIQAMDALGHDGRLASVMATKMGTATATALGYDNTQIQARKAAFLLGNQGQKDTSGRRLNSNNR
jgi:hypothetical protein